MQDHYFEGIHPQTGRPAVFLKKADGRVFYVRDAVEYERQHDQNSHVSFFERQKQADPYWEYRRKMRAQAIAQEVEEAVLSRVVVNNRAGTNVRTVSDHTFLTELQEDPSFVPLAKYHDKLKAYKTINGVRQWTGKWLRPVLSGEVGMIGEQILILEEPYSRGVAVQRIGDLNGDASRSGTAPHGGRRGESSSGVQEKQGGDGQT